VTVKDEKMSKSLGNFFTLKEIFEKYDPQVVRFFYLQTHYRAPIDFFDEVLVQAKNGLTRILDFYRRISKNNSIEGETISDSVKIILKDAQTDFEAAMENDFETGSAITAWFNLIKAVNKLLDENKINLAEQKAILDLLEKLNNILGVLKPNKEEVINEEVESLIKDRNQARADRNWALADQIRDKLAAMNIVLEDGAGGTTWKKN